MKNVSPTSPQSGFTLIELSIVLVIIGLIVGGILVGQDMIRAAEIRSTIKQVETYNTAANTFRDKYKYLPGDIVAASATNFGFAPTRTGGAGDGDGNGLLQANTIAATTASKYIGYETGLFWRDLATASMIGDNMSVATAGFPAATLSGEAVGTWIPLAKMARGNYVTVYASGGFNQYQLGGVTQIDTAGIPTLTASMTPQEAFNIDTKMDDGIPTSGIARARDAGAAAVIDTYTPVAGCVTSGVYLTTSATVANTPNCALRIRFN